MQSTAADTETKEVCGIEFDPDDFPQRRDSPDPAEVIRALCECGGVIAAAADKVGCGRRTLYQWSHRYEPINRAIEENREAVAYESRDRLVDLMRQDEDKRVAKDSAVKLLTMFDPNLDWSRKERREITRKDGDDEEAESVAEELENMGVDGFLDTISESE